MRIRLNSLIRQDICLQAVSNTTSATLAGAIQSSFDTAVEPWFRFVPLNRARARKSQGWRRLFIRPYLPSAASAAAVGITRTQLLSLDTTSQPHSFLIRLTRRGGDVKGMRPSSRPHRRSNRCRGDTDAAARRRGGGAESAGERRPARRQRSTRHAPPGRRHE